MMQTTALHKRSHIATSKQTKGRHCKASDVAGIEVEEVLLWLIALDKPVTLKGFISVKAPASPVNSRVVD